MSSVKLSREELIANREKETASKVQDALSFTRMVTSYTPSFNPSLNICMYVGRYVPYMYVCTLCAYMYPYIYSTVYVCRNIFLYTFLIHVYAEYI